MTTETKTKTCPRCNGKGTVTHPVVHCGVPGGCYQCDMKGTVQWISREELNAKLDKGRDKHLVWITEKAAELKATKEGWSDRRKNNPLWERRHQQSLQDLRDLWIDVKQGNSYKHVARGKWVSYTF